MNPPLRRAQRATSTGAWGRWWVRWLVAPLVLLVCATAPWLVPWPWQNVSDSAAAPASPVIVRSQPGSSEWADPGPTDETVKKLGKRLKDQKDSYDLPVDRAEVKGVTTEPGPYVKLGRIAIPRVGVDVSFGEGVFPETLDRGPGHWPGTPMPGRAGNAVISGHRNTNTQPFKRIDELNSGDTITVTVVGKSPVTYTIDESTIVPEPMYRDFVLRQPKAAKARTLTIFACHPEGNPSFRIVVQATAGGAR